MKAALVRTVVRLLIAPVAALVAVLVVMTAGAPGAHAATDLSKVAEELRENPVYVDPAASDQLAASDAEALADKIKDADKPVFVAVLPADVPKQDLFRNLRTETGVTGLYGVRVGEKFDARADSAVMSRQAVSNLVTAVRDAGDTKAQLNDFVDGALRSVDGSAPSSWSDGSGTDVPVGGLITFGALVAVEAARAPTRWSGATGAATRRSSGPRWRSCGWWSTRTSPPSARSSTASTSTPGNPAPTTRCAPTTSAAWTPTNRRSP